CTSEEMNAF
nr:Chain C, CYS-THR-SER-GLU-GLU-MET-ASN-ALA-PHE [Equine infectious anemia virus]